MTNRESTAMVPLKLVPQTSLMPSAAEQTAMAALSERFVENRGSMFPKEIDTPGKLFAILEAGRELGMAPMVALEHIFVVNGKTQPSAQAMAGVILAREPTAQLDIKERGAERCTIRLERRNRAPVELTFAMKDVPSKLRGKAGPWQDHPADMLTWYTMKRVCRLGAPDLINAIDGSVTLASGEQMFTQAEPLPPAAESDIVDGESRDVTDEAPAAEQVPPTESSTTAGSTSEVQPAEPNPEPSQGEPGGVPAVPERDRQFRGPAGEVDFAAFEAYCTQEGVSKADLGRIVGGNVSKGVMVRVKTWLDADPARALVDLVGKAKLEKAPAEEPKQPALSE